MKKVFAVLAACVMMGSLFTGCGAGSGDKKASAGKPAPKKQFINIATGGTAGTYFPLGGALANILNKAIPGANAAAQSSGGSVANVNLLKEGKVDIGFVQNDITYYAAHGTEMFKGKQVGSLKALTCLYPETEQIVTTKDTGIKSIADLKGKRVSVGPAGSGSEANARQVLEEAGLTYDDIKPQYLSLADASNAMKDGNVDANFCTGASPTAAIQDLAAVRDVVVIPVEGDLAAKLMKKYPFYAKDVVPANTYKGVSQDVHTIAVKCMLVTTDKMSDELGYNVVKALYGNLDAMKAAHNVGKFITKKTAKEGLSIDLNKGAEKYFNEK